MDNNPSLFLEKYDARYGRKNLDAIDQKVYEPVEKHC
jgi:hypothetical protein